MNAHKIEDRAHQIYNKIQREKCLISVYHVNGVSRTTKTDRKLSAARQGDIVGRYDPHVDMTWVEEDMAECINGR
jgi:hypothetical protein